MTNKPGREFQFDAMIFEQYIMPEGYLSQEPACHALWYYFVTTQSAVKRIIEQEQMVLEGEPDAALYYRDHVQRFKSIAALYGVAPEEMQKHWAAVDMQANVMGLKKLPEEYRLREVPTVRTQ